MRNFFRSSKPDFVTRSPKRDHETDRNILGNILSSIENGLNRAETERAGLQNRVDEVLARASIVAGNNMDEYITRTDERTKMLCESENEIRAAQTRLVTLKENVVHLTFLKAALKSRFPGI